MPMSPVNGVISVHLHSLTDELNVNQKNIPALAVLLGKGLTQLRRQGNRVRCKQQRSMGTFAAMASGRGEDLQPSMSILRTLKLARHGVGTSSRSKYLDSCLQQHKDFTPLFYSIDGNVGQEVRNAEK